MSVRAVIGLDIGTTSVKAVAVSDAGDVIGSAASGSLTLTAPEPGWAVQSTADFCAAIVDCLRDLVTALPADIEWVALSAAVQSGSLVLVDGDGRPGAEMTTWMDTRTSDLVDGWHRDGTATSIRRISGWSAEPGLGLAQIAWLGHHDADVWERFERVGSADDLAVSLLTGSWITNPSNAAGMQLIDIATGEWSTELCAIAGISVDRLSDLLPSGAPVGGLTDEMAAATGLPDGLTIINGGHDQTCTALALGVDTPGEALLAMGTAWVLTTVVDAADIGSVPDAMNISFHVVEGRRTTSRYLGGMGASIEWWLTEAGLGGDGARYARLDTESASAEVTLDSPFFLRTSDRNDGGDPGDTAEQPGAGRFWPDGVGADPASGALAIFEFAAFEVRTALAALPAAHRPTTLTLVGGATRSPGWPQMIANVCAIPVVVAPAHSWPAIGAAMLAEQSDHTPVDAEGENLNPRVDAVSILDHRYRTHLELSQENR